MAAGLSTLRSPARDMALGDAGGAGIAGPDRALVNPGALSVTGKALWLEAGDQSGIRQQRLGLALNTLWLDWSLDLGLDSLEGLQRRDDAGNLLGDLALQSPWLWLGSAHDSPIGRFGLAGGARDRRWLGGGWAAEGGAGWSWSHGAASAGTAWWWRDLASGAQASLGWQPGSQLWGLESGAIFEASETRYGLGAFWKAWPGLALRLGWERWTQYQNERWSLGLGWQQPSTSLSYGWVPGAAVGSAQKIAVLGSIIPVASPTQTSTSTPSPTPSPVQSPTITPTPAPAPHAIEMDLVLPK